MNAGLVKFGMVGQAVLSLDAAGRINYHDTASRQLLGYIDGELSGRHFSILFPAHEMAGEAPDRLLNAAAAQGRYQEEMWVQRADGSCFRADTTITSLLGAGGDVEFLVAIWDVAARERHQDQVQGAVEISEAILAGQQLEAVLHLIVRRARSLLGAEAAWIVLAGSEGEVSCDWRSGGTATSGRGGLVPPSTEQGELRHTATLEQVVEVPLVSEGRNIGTLFVANRPGTSVFPEHDLEPLQLFADQAALAIRLAEVECERERMAAWERERLARELHDGTIQSLYSVTLGLATVSTRALDWDLRDQLAGLAGTLQSTIEDLRNYIFELGPSILAGRRLDEAVLELIDDFKAHTGMVVIDEVDPQAGHSLAGQAGDVIQIIREALSNVGRHAQARRCRVSLSVERDEARLVIEDDGVGFDQSRVRPGQHGLRNLRERVSRLGGNLSIDSAPGAGSAIRITIPAAGRTGEAPERRVIR